MRTPPNRALIVNADDLGLSSSVNRGIIDAHRDGIVTRASLMVRAGAAREAADLAKAAPELEIGLHLDMGEWVFRDRTWVALYEVVDLGDARAVAAEVDRQLRIFRDLMNRDPTHLDSHQHVHRREPLASIAIEAAKRLGVPLRHFGPARFCGEFFGQNDVGEPFPAQISADSLLSLLRQLPDGLSELCCHPGHVDDALARTGTMYRDERLLELRALCDPRVRAGLVEFGIELVATDRKPVIEKLSRSPRR
jgi:predicted glycoside hydrolase/deacetylase ChbG (UPF0249 family)